MALEVSDIPGLLYSLVKRSLACTIAGTFLWLSQASASSLQVSPVMLDLRPEQAAEGLWLSNSGTTPLRAQLRVFRWSQPEGADVLTATTDLAASPPMILIPPGQRQMIRLVRVNKGLEPSAAEQTYRVVIDELPLGGGTGGVQFALRYSIPVFVSGAVKASAPVLNWKVAKQGPNYVLRAENTGHTRAQVADISFTSASGKHVVLSKGLYGYVLAGSTREWMLKSHGTEFLSGGVLTAKINQQAVNVSLPSVFRPK